MLVIENAKQKSMRQKAGIKSYALVNSQMAKSECPTPKREIQPTVVKQFYTRKNSSTVAVIDKSTANGSGGGNPSIKSGQGTISGFTSKNSSRRTSGNRS
jgi:hypothetical protein